jgi:hypothetical protein
MRFYVARFGGLALALVALAGGILVGRVIEAVAVGAVLFAIWTTVARLAVPPADDGRRGDREWS